MITGSAAIGANWFLEGVSALQRRELQTQRQISSGFRVQDAADSPSQTPELIGLVSQLSANQSYQSNLGRVQAEVGSADKALSSGISLIESARTIALQGANSTATSADRQNLANQVQSIQQQLVSLANTTTEGRFIFGGDQESSPPYQFDSAAPAGVDKLTSQTATRSIVDPSGETVYQSETAANIFDHRDAGGSALPDNAFVALRNLSTALTNNDPAGVSGALTSLESVSSWLNQQQASYGVSAARLATEQTSVSGTITSIQTQISGIRDTNIVQAATDLAQETTAQTAAFSAQAEIPRKSLFDYLG